MPLVLAILFFFWSFGVFHLAVYQSPSYYHHGLPTQDKTLIQCDYRFLHLKSCVMTYVITSTTLQVVCPLGEKWKSLMRF